MKYLLRPRKEIKYPVKILFDDREKKPWNFNSSHFYMKRKRLAIGDYTIEGFEDKFVIEKKDSLRELLINTSVSKMNWFKDQMYRLSKVPYKFLIVQDSLDKIDIAYRELSDSVHKVKFSKSTLIKWVASINTEFGIPVLFTGRNQLYTMELVEQVIIDMVRYKL